MSPSTPSNEAGLESTGRAVDRGLLRRLGLTLETVLSNDGDSFVTAACVNERGDSVVLKYVHSGGNADAHRRLKNETALVKHLSVRPPLRLLAHYDDGPGYLVTRRDDGRLLRPASITAATARAVASALVQFQALHPDTAALGVHDRERLATYYLKVLLKNLLHLWPDHLTAADAGRCQAIVTAALPAICRHRVICHGDFLPTNVLYHEADGSVTFTDLEGFMTGNHPLFDLLAFCTTGRDDLADWTWQRELLNHYLIKSSRPAVDPQARDYRDAYHGVLVFFLVYRLSETRMQLNGGAYFDNLGKRRFLLRKASRLATRRTDAVADPEMDVRHRNLQWALDRDRYREHLETMHAAAAISA